MLYLTNLIESEYVYARVRMSQTITRVSPKTPKHIAQVTIDDN